MTARDEPAKSRLQRWSDRKLAQGPEAPPEPEAETDAVRAEELEANRAAAEAVDLSELTAGSDLSVFLKDGVPDLLRRQALAALWRSDPVFANTDGLVDYGENFADPSLTMKTFKSAWQIGKGYLREAVTEAEPEPGTAPPDEPVEPAQPVETAELPAEDDPAPEPEQAEPDPPKVSLRRRLALDDPPA